MSAAGAVVPRATVETIVRLRNRAIELYADAHQSIEAASQAIARAAGAIREINPRRTALNHYVDLLPRRAAGSAPVRGDRAVTTPSYREQAEAVARAADHLSGERPRLMSTREVEREVAALRRAISPVWR